MLLRIVLSLVYIWYKESSSSYNATKSNSHGKNKKFPLLLETFSNRSSKFSLGNGVNGTGDEKSVDQRINDINDQICVIAQNCPISVQTLLDMGCAIRNFKHSTFENRQKHYEDKFREVISRQRSEKRITKVGIDGNMNANYNRTLYTAAFDSKIVNTEAAAELMCALPNRYQLETPKLLFRLSEHGASFVRLWSQ